MSTLNATYRTTIDVVEVPFGDISYFFGNCSSIKELSKKMNVPEEYIKPLENLRKMDDCKEVSLDLIEEETEKFVNQFVPENEKYKMLRWGASEYIILSKGNNKVLFSVDENYQGFSQFSFPVQSFDLKSGNLDE